jgi:predicted dienelactone hydrolase
LEWVDAARGRTIPIRIYYPKGALGPFPVILFSHGLGGSRDGYRYLGERWASRGFVSVHLQHPGSDGELLEQPRPMQALRKAAADPANALERPRDVTFALNTLARLNGEGAFPLKGRLDMTRVGVGGHSFGAYTALTVSGRRFEKGGGMVTLVDPRVKACVALSSPSQGKERDCPTYRGFRAPCLHMTGTEDGSSQGRPAGEGSMDQLIGNTPVAYRRVPYDCITGSDQYLVTFQGGDHMVFSGRARQTPKATDAHFQQLVRMATTAFWDATLQGDPTAKAWLSGGGLLAALGGAGSLEQKAPNRS